MSYTRREFGKLTLAGLPALAAFGPASRAADARLEQTPAKPNSKIAGVQLGVITYSYRDMPDQGGEATLRYILASGVNAVELMDGPAERFAGAPLAPSRPNRDRPPRPRTDPPTGTWNGQPCWGERAAAPRRPPSPEEVARAAALKEWRTSASMDRFKQLRKMFNDAGVTIYAYKSDGMTKNMKTSDAELDYLFNVASALGATHTTMELPSGDDAEAMMARMAQFAEKHKVAIAYHTHAQGSMTAFDRALAVSKWTMSNVDFGHYVAAGNVGGSAVQFLEKYHDRIASFHLKDRTTPPHCSLNVPFGRGETPIRELLLTLKKNQWPIPASIEMEYTVPEGSDPVQETKKCVDYCKGILNP